MDLQQRRKIEFGDFQTPLSLAREVCALLARQGFKPATILEPTCGTGAFLQAALEFFPGAARVVGVEINPEYVIQARHMLVSRFPGAAVEIHQADFFHVSWPDVLSSLPQPLLVIGNPPWVTNAALGALESGNAPVKGNFDHLNGLDALTGKSNFDISEWILRQALNWLNGKDGALAMLCKTTVARKVLHYAWQKEMTIASAALYTINAQAHFGVAVDAALLLIQTQAESRVQTCQVYPSLDAHAPERMWGWEDGRLIANLGLYQQWRDLAGVNLKGWRSGIKHDCAQVFELHTERGQWVNGLGETVDLEPESVLPLLKSSDLAAHREPRRWLVVPQRNMSDDPARLREQAPKTWAYLEAHAALLDRRKSSIYRQRPRFAIFGVGPYTFAPWKVAISGLYKKLDFVRVPPYQERPVVLDDTCYAFPCSSKEECDAIYALLTSRPAQEFWLSLIFWDAKRPITAQLLNALDLAALARRLGHSETLIQTLTERQRLGYTEGPQQPLLWWMEEHEPIHEPELSVS